MQFKLHSNSTNEKNALYVNIFDDEMNYIGNTLIRYFTYNDSDDFEQQMNQENTYTRSTCNIAAQHMKPGESLAYIGILELDYRYRGKGYGKQILNMIPQMCLQFGFAVPDFGCAYICPHGYKLDLETYQHERISRYARSRMWIRMYKTFRSAGFYTPKWTTWRVVMTKYQYPK